MQEHLFELLNRYSRNEASEAEVAELLSLLQDPANHPFIEQYLLENETMMATEPDWEQVWRQIDPQKRRRVISWKQWAAAASIVFVIGLSLFFLLRPGTSSQQPPFATIDVQAPPTARPQLILPDGTTIAMDSLHAGLVTTTGAAALQKLPDGRLKYQTAETSVEPIYHTIENPRGSKVVDLTLSDGSRIWLNAGSTLRYPVPFNKNSRQIEMSGEIYLEVAHDADRPFTVMHGKGKTEVLGTQFNVEAYNGDSVERVTLKEGSVKVSAIGSRQSAIIKPGQQAVFTADSRLPIADSRLTIHGADLEKTLAWTNNEFVFDDDPINLILPQLERWYDVAFSIQTTTTASNYTGRISRTASLAQVLKLFEKLGYLRFVIHGKKIDVLPAKK